MHKTSTKELLLWIKSIKNNNSDDESLYLFLDLCGGISKADLNLLKLTSKEFLFLNENLNCLKKKWLEYSKNHKPIQYVCNSTYWRNIKLELSNYVLIPRVETEQIVEIATDLIKSNKNNITFAELGTGSGAISISLLLKKNTWKGLATDIDKNTLKVAKRNYKNILNSSNLLFFCGSWWQPLMQYSGMLDLVISNPPYIPTKVYKKLPSSVKDYEPKLALCGGEDGLDHIKEIISGAPKFLKKGGWIILENHFDQSQLIKNLLQKKEFNSVKTINDVFGIGRFTIGRYK